jgi:glutathione S-transferase
MNTLITIPFSHFCEKARWALDWCLVPYRERACLPGLHLRHTRRAGGKTVPLLLCDDGAALCDSTAILRWADAHAPVERKLYGDAEAEHLEEDFDERLGPATRLWLYAHGLRNRPLLRALVAPSFPRRRDRAALALLLPAVAPLIMRQYGVTADSARAAEEIIVTAFADVSTRLSRQRYIAGDRFGAADLTFAALGGALLQPPEHPSLSSAVTLPPEAGPLMERLRATPAAAFALRMYREHRRQTPEIVRPPPIE